MKFLTKLISCFILVFFLSAFSEYEKYSVQDPYLYYKDEFNFKHIQPEILWNISKRDTKYKVEFETNNLQEKQLLFGFFEYSAKNPKTGKLGFEFSRDDPIKHTYELTLTDSNSPFKTRCCISIIVHTAPPAWQNLSFKGLKIYIIETDGMKSQFNN